LLAVGGEACGAAVDNPTLRIGGCGGLEVQGMHGEGYGVSDPRTGVAGWAAPTASIFLDMKVASWLWFASRIDGIVPLSRPTFVLDDVGPVFRVNAVSARVAVGFEVRF
jgi:hypothetical protein